MADKNIKSDNDLLTLRKNENAITELINRYKPTVEAIAMKYINSPLEKDDLIQEGMIGLLAAINSYREEKGASFSTYAGHCINNSIQSALRKVSRLKDIPQSSLVSIEDDYFNDVVHLSAEDEYLAKESVSDSRRFAGLSPFAQPFLPFLLFACHVSAGRSVEAGRC